MQEIREIAFPKTHIKMQQLTTSLNDLLSSHIPNVAPRQLHANYINVTASLTFTYAQTRTIPGVRASAEELTEQSRRKAKGPARSLRCRTAEGSQSLDWEKLIDEQIFTR